MILGQGQRRLTKYIGWEKQFSIKVISYFYDRVRGDVAVVTMLWRGCYTTANPASGSRQHSEPPEHVPLKLRVHKFQLKVCSRFGKTCKQYTNYVHSRLHHMHLGKRPCSHANAAWYLLAVVPLRDEPRARTFRLASPSLPTSHYKVALSPPRSPTDNH
jgi:hypothetical protein